MSLTIVDVVGILVAILAVIFTYYKRSFQYWKKKNVPSLEPKIPLGNIGPIIGRKEPFGDEIAQLYLKIKKKGWKYAGLYIFVRPVFIPVDLDLIKHIMTKDFNHFVDRGIYVNETDEPIGAHLFAIGGVKWRNLRTKFTPTFTSGKMRTMFQTLANCGAILEKYIDDSISNTNKEPIEIKSVLGCFSTDIIGSCAFGLECNTFKEPDSPFRKFGNKIFQQTRIGLLKISISQNFPELAKKLHLKLFPQDVAEFFTTVVRKTVEFRETNHIERKDFLQMLIEIKNNKELLEGGQKGDGTTLTLDEMVAQSFVFFVAGFETSSTTMTFALFELARNQEIQNKVREEINIVLKQHNNQITYDSLKQLEYLGQVINETLRKYPALPFVTRRCVDDYTIPDTNIVIEKNTRIFIPIKGIHYDEEYFPNPEVFDPDRFSPENIKNRHQYAHIPFGEGPRICIGMRFGIMQSKVGLVSILRNYKVTLDKKTKIPLKMVPTSFIPNTEGGIWLNIEKFNSN